MAPCVSPCLNLCFSEIDTCCRRPTAVWRRKERHPPEVVHGNFKVTLCKCRYSQPIRCVLLHLFIKFADWLLVDLPETGLPTYPRLHYLVGKAGTLFLPHSTFELASKFPEPSSVKWANRSSTSRKPTSISFFLYHDTHNPKFLSQCLQFTAMSFDCLLRRTSKGKDQSATGVSPLLSGSAPTAKLPKKMHRQLAVLPSYQKVCSNILILRDKDCGSATTKTTRLVMSFAETG